MRRVGVEEAAAIGAQHLDGFLRSHRALRDGLLRAFERGRVGVGMQILNHALRAEQQRANDRERQQDIKRRARQIDPEVADGLALDWRAKPRTSAIAIASPAAAEMKLCTVSPAIWTK